MTLNGAKKRQTFGRVTPDLRGIALRRGLVISSFRESPEHASSLPRARTNPRAGGVEHLRVIPLLACSAIHVMPQRCIGRSLRSHHIQNLLPVFSARSNRDALVVDA